MVRPGIMLYGASPLLDQSAQTLGLRPAMTLTTSVISIQRLEAGETVGYGATWQACAPATIAVAGIGYGDGYPRHAGSGTPVLVNGQRCELAGRVSMDMITIRIPDGMPVAVGDPVTLWGEGLPADEVARAAGTIAYELFCRLSARVRFSYADNEATLPGESISAHDR
jgi:alanine racemase